MLRKFLAIFGIALAGIVAVAAFSWTVITPRAVDSAAQAANADQRLMHDQFVEAWTTEPIIHGTVTFVSKTDQRGYVKVGVQYVAWDPNPGFLRTVDMKITAMPQNYLVRGARTDVYTLDQASPIAHEYPGIRYILANPAMSLDSYVPTTRDPNTLEIAVAFIGQVYTGSWWIGVLMHLMVFGTLAGILMVAIYRPKPVAPIQPRATQRVGVR